MATTLYTGGRVLPCDGVTPADEALVVRDGRIAGVGAREAMARLAGPGAERVDLRGATLLPGFVDTHPHLLHFGAFAEPLVDLADATSHDDVVARIRARAATTPARPLGRADDRRRIRRTGEGGAGELPRTRVLRTVMGGRTVWDAGAL
jgi:predicted amidohydrolase YtcJ